MQLAVDHVARAARTSLGNQWLRLAARNYASFPGTNESDAVTTRARCERWGNMGMFTSVCTLGNTYPGLAVPLACCQFHFGHRADDRNATPAWPDAPAT